MLAVTVILGKAEDNPEFFEERHRELEIKKLRKTQDMVFLNENHPLASRNTFSDKRYVGSRRIPFFVY